MTAAVGPTGWIRASDKARRVIVVSGAKGGVGKTMFAANLAVYLATIGRRVVLVDADSAGANAHTLLGCERPRPTDQDSLGAFVDTAIPGLRLLRAGLDRPASGGYRAVRRSRLLEGVRELEADYIVIDVGSGTVSTLLDLYLNADLSVYLALPEPTAIENTYRFLRGAFLRHLRTHAPNREMRGRILHAMRVLGGTPPPRDLYESLAPIDEELSRFVQGEMRSFVPRVVMNQARVRADLELGDAMRTAVHRRFSIDIDYLGHIEYDDTVWSCLRARRPLLVESPGTKASKGIEKIARRLLSAEIGRARRVAMPLVPYESHHDLLEVERSATDEEVRRAYKRAREVYAPDSLVCYALFEPKELDGIRARVDEANEVLLDPLRRKPYEQLAFADLAPEKAVEPAREVEAAVLPPMPDITPDTDFNGPLLRSVREARGLSLKEISAKTKIGVVYLAAIEEDDFNALPDAPVYVRGFVAEFARTLGLDADHVCRGYVRRYRRYVEDKKARGST